MKLKMKMLIFIIGSALAAINSNAQITDKKYSSLIAQLDSIYNEDQKYRIEIDVITEKFGWESKEMNELWRKINKADSINLTKVAAIIDKYGWLGKDKIGDQGNITLFLVIQHSNQAIQEKYLPIMREAVKNGNAEASSLAYLEDRIALGQGKRQIYGTQIMQDPDSQINIVCPLDDPDGVDKRRASVGLEPIQKYLDNFQIKWDVEQYKKDLSKIEEKYYRK